MDFEFAIWQMLYLFYKPQNVYRNFQYRKVRLHLSWLEHFSIIIMQETKAQFARDDPAFLVLLAALLLVSTVRRRNKLVLKGFDGFVSRLASLSSSASTSGLL